MKAYQKMVDGRVITAYVDGKSGVVAAYDPNTRSERRIATLNGDALRQAERLYGPGFTEVGSEDAPKRVASRNPYDGRTFKTARRRLTMQERIALINEDAVDPDDAQI